MKAEVILLGAGECPFEVLAKMGKQTQSAWVFLHKNVVEFLKKRRIPRVIGGPGGEMLIWHGTVIRPTETICFEENTENWKKVYSIKTSNIAFESEPEDPENIIFLKKAY